MKTFGQVLREVREARNLSQAEVARRGKLSHQRRMTDYEEKGVIPSVEQARQLALGLGLTLTELIALWEGIDLPQTENDVKKVLSAADDEGQGQGSRRGSTTMADRDPFRRAVNGAYDSVAYLPREARQAFADQVRRLAGEITGAAVRPAERRKTKRGNERA